MGDISQLSTTEGLMTHQGLGSGYLSTYYSRRSCQKGQFWQKGKVIRTYLNTLVTVLIVPFPGDDPSVMRTCRPVYILMDRCSLQAWMLMVVKEQQGTGADDTVSYLIQIKYAVKNIVHLSTHIDTCFRVYITNLCSYENGVDVVSSLSLSVSWECKRALGMQRWIYITASD